MAPRRRSLKSTRRRSSKRSGSPKKSPHKKTSRGRRTFRAAADIDISNVMSLLGEVSGDEQKLLESFDQPLLQHIYETLEMVEKAKKEQEECKRQRRAAQVQEGILREEMIKKIEELEKEKGGKEERENTLAGMQMVLEKIKEKLSP